MGNNIEAQSSTTGSDESSSKIIRDFHSKQDSDDGRSKPNLSDSFKRQYQLTDRECPFCDDESRLWSNSFELVCESCAAVIGEDHYLVTQSDKSYYHPFSDDNRLTYNNSGNVVMAGGYFNAYSGDGIYGSSSE